MMRTLILVASCSLMLAPAATQAEDKAKQTPVPQTGAADVQEIVFLGQARPLLIRFRVRVDGKPLEIAWRDFIAYLHADLDRNGDGHLDKAEAERARSASQLFGGGNRQSALFGSTVDPSLNDFDTSKDKKVSVDELGAYYRKKGLAPFQMRRDSSRDPLRGATAIFGGGQAEPPVEAVSKASFRLLDVDKNGKLSLAEMAAAPERAMRLDEDEDEIVTAAEMAPDAVPKLNPYNLGAMMGQAPKDKTEGNVTIVHLNLATPTKVSPSFAAILQKRYGVAKEKDKPPVLRRNEIGLDQATFAKLDGDGNGSLNEKELLGFVLREPDLEFVVRLGTADKNRLELVTPKERDTVAKVSAKADEALVDLGVTRLNLRGVEEDLSTPFDGFIRQQLRVQMEQADKNRDGVVDEKEAKDDRRFRGRTFERVDRDGDRKVTKKEIDDYLEHSSDLQARARSACVSLVLSDESRGVHTLFDTSGDGRLSVRELRQGPKLLQQYDRAGKSHLTQADVPKLHRITLRRGPESEGQGNQAAFLRLYSGALYKSTESDGGAGPRWFRKMDRNRDGDVSPREFLFSKEDFRRIDVDGDKLISPKEASKAAR